MSNPQVEAMKALLSHPTNKKLFREAAASPVGSTKRAQAQRVLSIMSKVQKNYDGAGGAANMYQEYTQASAPKAPAKPYEPQSVVIFHKLPKMCVNFDGNPWKDPEPEPVADGAGGPTNIYDGAGGSVSDWFSGALDTFASAAGTTAKYALNPIGSAIYDLSKTQQDIPNASRFEEALAAPSKLTDSLTSSIGNAAKSLGTGIVKTVGGAVEGIGNAASDMYHYTFDPQYKGQAADQNTFNPNLSPQVGVKQPDPMIGPVQPGQSNPNSFNPNLSPQVGITEATMNAAKNPVNPTNPGVQPLTDEISKSWFKTSTTTPTNPVFEGPSLPSNKQTDSLYSYNSGYPSQQQNSGTSGTSGQHGSAAKNISTSLGGVALPTPFTSDFIKGVGYEALRNAFKTNEGGSVEGVVNNPGNIKYEGLVGQYDSGVKATDGGTFASYKTIEDGNKGMDALFDAIASGKTSYGASPTLGSVADRWTNTGSSSGGYASQNNSGSNPSASAAVASNLGKSGFAWNQITNPNDPITGGQTAAQRAVADEKSAWDQFKIGELQQKQADLRAAGAKIPEQVADYIRGRDTYIKETDKMIDEYVDKTANNSDPLSRQSAADHLNYLYTLRGMQNKSYIEYLNSAVNQNKNQLQEVTDAYTIAMNGYTKALAQKNSLTKEMYDSYSTALQDMYTEVKEAPERALGIQKIQMEIYKGYAQAAADGPKNVAQNGYLKDAKILDDFILDSPGGYLRPGINLNDAVNEIALTDNTVAPTSVVQNYLKGLNNLLNADTQNAKTKEGTPISNGLKIKYASDAIQQFADFANTAMNAGISTSYLSGVENAQTVASKLASLTSSELAAPEKSLAIKKAITSLSPSGSTIKFLWTKPTKAKFIENLTASGIDFSVATALYNQYLRYTSPSSEPIQNAAFSNISNAVNKDISLLENPTVKSIYNSTVTRDESGKVFPGGSPDSFVHALLYNDTGTEGRANPIPLDDRELAQRIAGIYAQDLLFSALAGVPAGPGTTLSQ